MPSDLEANVITFSLKTVKPANNERFFDYFQ